MCFVRQEGIYGPTFDYRYPEQRHSQKQTLLAILHTQSLWSSQIINTAGLSASIIIYFLNPLFQSPFPKSLFNWIHDVHDPSSL